LKAHRIRMVAKA